MLYTRSAVTYAATALCTLSDGQREAVLNMAEDFAMRSSDDEGVTRLRLIAAVVRCGVTGYLAPRDAAEAEAFAGAAN